MRRMKGAGEIGFTIVSLTVSLIAVLIPLLFMQEVVGRLFREFAITLAITILISARRVADPGADAVRQAAAQPRSRGKKAGRLRAQDRGIFQPLHRANMTGLLIWVLRHQPLTLLVAVATLVLTVLLYIVIPKGFFPLQDTGFVQGITQAGPTVSFDEMARRQQALAAKILQDKDVDSLSSFIGVDGTNNTLNSGRFLINLKPKDRPRQRHHGRWAACRKTPMPCRASRSICSRCRT